MALDVNKLDKSVPIPLYFQLKELILAEIKNGTYQPDSLIPTENELSEMFQISRTTVRQAITELVNEGWLYRVKSKGTFVSRPKIHQEFIAKMESFNTEMERKGLTPSTEVLEFKVMNATEQVANALQIPEKELVIYLYRKRYGDDEPIVTVKTYLPFEECKFLLDKDLSKATLYSLLDNSDTTKIVSIQRRIEAVEANSKDVEHLRISRGKPIHFFTSIGRNALGKVIEYSQARYRGDRNEFEVTLSRD